MLSKVCGRCLTFNVLGFMETEVFFWDEDAIRKNEIKSIIREHWILIDNYYINEEGNINVEGNVKFSENMDFLKELPLKFNKVSGDFDCSKLSLESLKGSPTEVGGTFNCSYNQLSTLEYLPKKAGCFVFDNTVKSLNTGGVNCNFNKVVLMYITNIQENVLSEKVVQNSQYLDVIFKYQNYYAIWDVDMILDEESFAGLIKEVDEGLK